MKFSYNFDDKNYSLNNINNDCDINNKSYDFIMPPNDLSDIVRKNIIFNKTINSINKE